MCDSGGRDRHPEVAFTSTKWWLAFAALEGSEFVKSLAEKK